MSTQSSVDYALRPLNPYRLAAIRDHAGPHILDVGCGNGAYVLALSKEYKIYGVDYREFQNWEVDPGRFSVSDAHKLHSEDASVDTVVSFETLEHLENPKKALEEYFRVCRNNIIITVPNCELTDGLKASGLIYNHWIDRSHVNFWTLRELEQLVTSVGFTINVAARINPISVGPVLMEALGLKGLAAKFGSKIVRALRRNEHPMTLLVIADKIKVV